MGELSLIDKSKFGWTETERYTILDLGTMPNAIVIKKEEGGSRYCISLRSYFSFQILIFLYNFKATILLVEI